MGCDDYTELFQSSKVEGWWFNFMLQNSLLYLQKCQVCLAFGIHLVMQCTMQQPHLYSPLGAKGLKFHTVVYIYLDLLLPYSLSTLQ